MPGSLGFLGARRFNAQSDRQTPHHGAMNASSGD